MYNAEGVLSAACSMGMTALLCFYMILHSNHTYPVLQAICDVRYDMPAFFSPVGCELACKFPLYVHCCSFTETSHHGADIGSKLLVRQPVRSLSVPVHRSCKT